MGKPELLKNIFKPFYSTGLRFECKKCSKCCRLAPGYVFLSKKDLNKLIKAKKISKEIFLRKYCRTVQTMQGLKLSLIEKDNYDCIFWKETGCSIYKWRPVQCISFPFWESNLSSKKKWTKLELYCPGVNNGILYSQEDIRQYIKMIVDQDYFFLKKELYS